MKLNLSVLAAVTLMALAPARASVLLDVGGVANQGLSFDEDTAVAVSFTLDLAATNVSIFAPLYCFDCDGGIWLHRNSIGPGASFGDAIDAQPFNGATTQPFFTVAALDPGLYFFIASLNTASDGFAIWAGSSAPAITSAGATRGLDFLAETTQPFVPFSSFQAIFGENRSFTVTGELASPIPEPASWVLLLTGGLAAAMTVRRQRARGARAT